MSSNNPRHPRDLQALLKFCIEATKGEDVESNATELDEERKKWLKEALDNMAVDVVEQLVNGIKNINSTETDLEQKEETLDRLEDWLGNIDMAVNFHKIGGYSALMTCLKSPHPSLRSGAAHLIAEIGQNNPYCQEKFLEEGFLEMLTTQLDKDESELCKVKALYAISCVCRDCPTALARFSGPLDGWSVLVRALQTHKSAKIRTKVCFFLSACMNMDERLVHELVSMGLALQLVSILDEEPADLSHEHLLLCLHTMLSSSEKAKADILSMPSVQLERILQLELAECELREEMEESLEHCKNLLALISTAGETESAER